jgi:hypothetical protein
MSYTVVYDKAKWHYEGKWPAGLPEYQAYVHTGMFLGWVIDHKLYSEEFEEDCQDDIKAFEKRKLTGPQVYKRCEEKIRGRITRS